TQVYWLLTNNPKILNELHEKIQYIMIDEYQDTNYIQEQLVFLLAGKNKNIAVVGDDDQGLYRFRGATIRNILEFPNKFNKCICKQISLVINYRSDSKIVNFYNDWISTTSGANFKFEWDKFRFNKYIQPHQISTLNSPTVIKVSSQDNEDEWHENILKFINHLQSSGKVVNLNQIAFLFNSVKNIKVKKLESYLENHGIKVYSPRSDMFFYRYEIKLIIGILILMFPIYTKNIGSRNFKFVDERLCQYYESCVQLAIPELKKKENYNLLKWIKEHGIIHTNLTKNTDYAFSGLLYQMFKYSPFAEILNMDLNNGAVDLRPVRNIAMLSQIIAKFEYLHRVKLFSQKSIDDTVEKFFNMYMRFLFNGGISEYEDDSEYAPSGCVSFLTIHQAKGMEFPIVVVGSLGNTPRNRNSCIAEEIKQKYFHRKSFEPLGQIKYFDFWRLYYTAFSRAQNLLVLTCNEKNGHGRQPSKYFENPYRNLISFESDEFDINEFDFKKVKKVNLKEMYSFTSHISVYEGCSLQYKFFKELGFTPIRVGATVFGTLVHQTIEDIHRAAIRKEEHLITTDNIKSWFDTNYASISKSEHTYLSEPQIKAAYNQVINYVNRQHNDWSVVQEAEVEVSLVKPNYILQGTVDLITGDNNTVEIVDFKSEKKPNLVRDRERIEHYKKQLQIYAHLVEEKTGKTVSKMHLYYTGAENENPRITFKKDKTSIDKTIEEFDNIVDKIQRKEFCKKSKSQLICDNCDFRYYCNH
ncbi:MAG: ATP-dependent helicase, partial [Epulopiscium sp.]|nr:ATP-dependent helicase [Candidatus Epulonipiscium sp.]